MTASGPAVELVRRQVGHLGEYRFGHLTGVVAGPPTDQWIEAMDEGRLTYGPCILDKYFDHVEVPSLCLFAGRDAGSKAE